MRKAVIEIGKYTVKEGPNGGWRVFVTGAEQPITCEATREQALAAAKRFIAGDKRRAA